jgi:LDH2 family malate/lactate/ureidoglycolate dehydrogenase
VGTVDHQALLRWGSGVLRAVSVPPEQAGFVMETLVDADLRGTYSHGSRQLATYIARIRAGTYAPDAKVTVVRDAGAVALLDGGLGLGQVAARDAVDLATKKAGEQGVSVVSVRETTHFGALGFFTARAAEHGFLAVATQNGPPMVPPFGGITPLFATNPFSYAAPVAGEEPVVFDVATTAVAGNKVHQVRQRGGTVLPDGWMTDREGRPTRDAVAATQGFLQWAGGHKGYGLGLLVEIMAGVLADAPFGTEHNTKSPVSGHGRLAKGGTFIVIDPAALLGGALFAERMRTLVAEIRGSQPAAGVDRVRVPGDIERERKSQQLATGIVLESTTVKLLSALGAETGVGGLPVTDAC